MRKSKFTPEQIASVVRQAEAGARVEELCRVFGVSSATLYRWRLRYGGLGTEESRRLDELEHENRKLRSLVAELASDKRILEEVLAGKI